MRSSHPNLPARRWVRRLAMPAIAVASLAGGALLTASPASAHTVGGFDSAGNYNLTVDYGDGVHRDLSSDGSDSGFYYYSDNRA